MSTDNLRDMLTSEGQRFEQQEHDDRPVEPAPRKPKPAKYEQMKRIEGRIRPRQEVSLDNMRRTLIDRRTGRGERITNNTLLRVALAGLIAHKDVLTGDSEKEIEDSWLEFLDRAKRVATEAQQQP